MKKAGDLLSLFFDEYTAYNTRRISKVFTSWAAIAKEQRIPAAVDHAKIVELERNIVFIEADHPGWIQILQTKQQELLESFRQRFPELTISGISFRLSKGAIQAWEDNGAEYAEQAAAEGTGASEAAAPRSDDALSNIENNAAFKKLVLNMKEGTI
ncbi:MAG: DUF721 domain-containing protein [Treponema sp.]|jgi:hypothetical protein|nr:DUF721 domain-containing protein [Treponema sp.]